MRIIYFGTPNFSAEILENIVKNCSKAETIGVFTRSDQPQGRGQAITPSPVKITATELKLRVFTPLSLKDEGLIETVKHLKPDIFIVAAYGLFIPNEMLKIPKFGAINFHPSLLPKYRGASPIQSAILNGDQETGASLIKLVKEMDAGPIIAQEKVGIDPIDTDESLTKKLVELGGSMLVRLINEIADGNTRLLEEARSQNEAQASHCKKINKEDGLIAWEGPDAVIERKIRAFYSWPGTWTTLEELAKVPAKGWSAPGGKCQKLKVKNTNQRVKVLKAHLDEAGKLELDLIQIEGKRPISWGEFARGYLAS